MRFTDLDKNDFKDKVLKCAGRRVTMVDVCKIYAISAPTALRYIKLAFGYTYKELCRQHAPKVAPVQKQAIKKYAVRQAAHPKIKAKAAPLTVKELRAKRQVAAENLAAATAANDGARVIDIVTEKAKTWQPFHEVRKALGYTYYHSALLVQTAFKGISYEAICAAFSGFKSRADYRVEIITRIYKQNGSYKEAAEAAGVTLHHAKKAIRAYQKRREAALMPTTNKSTGSYAIGTQVLLPTHAEGGQSIKEVISSWQATYIDNTAAGVRATLPAGWRTGVGIFGRMVLFNSKKKKVASWDSSLKESLRIY